MKNHLTILILLLLTFFMSTAQPANDNLSNGIIFDGEPFLAINPINNQNLVAAWMGLQFSNGFFRIAIKTRATFDGGSSWSVTNSLPHFGIDYGSADVSLAFDQNGFLYCCYIDYKQSPDSGGIYVARSADGGLTWDTPTKAFDMYDVPNKRPIDRPWLVVDNSGTTNAGTLYITTKPAPWILPPNRNYYKVSTDSGYTWTAIANVDGGTHLVGNAIPAPMAAPATTANGKFCAVYPSYVASQNILPVFYLASSTDQGQTFSYQNVYAAVPAAMDTNYKAGYLLLANPADSNRLVMLLPLVLSGDPDVVAIHSNDGGLNWSNPVRVNDDLTGNGKAQDMVWGDYNEQGNLVVTWRDRRNAPANGFWNAGYDFYYATSGDNGQTFSANQLLTSQLVPFDSILTQNGNDFMCSVYSGDTLFSVWGDTRNGTMNIYFAKTIATVNTNVGFAVLAGDDNQWKIFPNPSGRELHLQVPQSYLGMPVKLYDGSGKIIFIKSISSTDYLLNLDELENGVYYMEIKNEVKRIIVGIN